MSTLQEARGFQILGIHPQFKSQCATTGGASVDFLFNGTYGTESLLVRLFQCFRAVRSSIDEVSDWNSRYLG